MSQRSEAEGSRGGAGVAPTPVDRTPWKNWNAALWRQYKADVAACMAREGEPWSSRIGVPALAMADWFLANRTVESEDGPLLVVQTREELDA